MIHCDIQACVGCMICEVVCSTWHFGAVSPALSRIRVAKLEEVGIDMAVACLSCLEKPCLTCPSDALSLGAQGEISLNSGLCGGCEQCVSACPIGAVGFFNELPLFCDLCGGQVVCVPACPTDALSCSEGYRETALEGFLPSEGNPGQKRARWAMAQGEPLRDSWAKGTRIHP